MLVDNPAVDRRGTRRPILPPWHPDNDPPIMKWEPDLSPNCPSREGGCMRHCSASCRLKLHCGSTILTYCIARYAGSDLPWQDTYEYEDTWYNQLGVACANQSGVSVSCVECCRRRCESDRSSRCCRSNVSLDKDDPKCKEARVPKCKNTPIGNLCRARCNSENPGISENSFTFKHCYFQCRRELGGLTNPFDI